MRKNIEFGTVADLYDVPGQWGVDIPFFVQASDGTTGEVLELMSGTRSVASATSTWGSTATEPRASEGNTSRRVFDERRAQNLEARPLVIPPNADLRQGTVMTIRVKKTDVDAFAKGAIDLKTFQARATLNVYVGAGYNTSSINTWPGRRHSLVR